MASHQIFEIISSLNFFLLKFEIEKIRQELISFYLLKKKFYPYILMEKSFTS